MVELSRIFHERSRGRGNGVANENGSRQGKLIRSGAMTREKLRSEIDERLSLSPHRYPRYSFSLSLSLSLPPCVSHPFAIFLNLLRTLVLLLEGSEGYQGNFELVGLKGYLCVERDQSLFHFSREVVRIGVKKGTFYQKRGFLFLAAV